MKETDLHNTVMKEISNVPRDVVMHSAILADMHKVYEAKNSDYGGNFYDLYEKYGMVSPLIKLSDKMSRLESLQHKKQLVVDESIEDTLLDMANYAVMTVIAMRLVRDKGEYCDGRR